MNMHDLLCVQADTVLELISICAIYITRSYVFTTFGSGKGLHHSKVHCPDFYFCLYILLILPSML